MRKKNKALPYFSSSPLLSLPPLLIGPANLPRSFGSIAAAAFPVTVATSRVVVAAPRITDRRRGAQTG